MITPKEASSLLTTMKVMNKYMYNFHYGCNFCMTINNNKCVNNTTCKKAQRDKLQEIANNQDL